MKLLCQRKSRSKGISDSPQGDTDKPTLEPGGTTFLCPPTHIQFQCVPSVLNKKGPVYWEVVGCFHFDPCPQEVSITAFLLASSLAIHLRLSLAQS